MSATLRISETFNNELEGEIMFGNINWSFQFTLVTPEMAKQFLLQNTSNRGLRRSTVAKYAATMASGNWVLSPEGICFSSLGRLLNGQHRLSAVVASGVSVPFLIISNVSEDIFSVLDRGLTRTFSDAVGISKKLAEVGRFAALIVSNDGNLNNSVTDNAVKEMCGILAASHSDLINSCNTTTKTFSSAPFRLAACVRMLAGFDPKYVKDTYKSLVLGHVGMLPPIAQSAIGAVMSGRWDAGSQGGARQKKHLAKAWDLFDPLKSQNTRIVVLNDDRSIDEIRVILAACKAAG